MCDSPVNKSMIYVRGGLLGAFKILFFFGQRKLLILSRLPYFNLIVVFYRAFTYPLGKVLNSYLY